MRIVLAGLLVLSGPSGALSIRRDPGAEHTGNGAAKGRGRRRAAPSGFEDARPTTKCRAARLVQRAAPEPAPYVISPLQGLRHSAVRPLLHDGISVGRPAGRDRRQRGRADSVGRQQPERHIVVSAHYDHVGVEGGRVFNGADDNASGTAALFALGKYFDANRPRHTLFSRPSTPRRST